MDFQLPDVNVVLRRLGQDQLYQLLESILRSGLTLRGSGHNPESLEDLEADDAREFKSSFSCGMDCLSIQVTGRNRITESYSLPDITIYHDDSMIGGWARDLNVLSGENGNHNGIENYTFEDFMAAFQKPKILVGTEEHPLTTFLTQ